jgi:hypothetical protein
MRYDMDARHEFERKNNVILMKKEDSRVMRFANFFFRLFGNKDFMTEFWTTYRLPFQKKATITYPDSLYTDQDEAILEHEMFHVRQLKPWYGPFVGGLLVTLFPLPIIFSGRWFMERHPYLNDIVKKRGTIDQVVDILWYGYGWCWPKSLMRKWFAKQIQKMGLSA